MHLLEDEEKITGILRALATEEHYSIFRQNLMRKYPGVRPSVAEHLCELEEFFGVCISVGFSLGISKMELLKCRVKRS